MAALFSPKLRLFVQGRKGVFGYLANQIGTNDKVIWVHTASLGEFEQGLPVIQALKKEFPRYKVLVTFFSPSGYEVKKGSKEADLITYLPIDSPDNVKRFLELTHPALVIFVKYEIWPNYLRELSKMEIPALLISARFTTNQVFFKWYGRFMRNTLAYFTQYFVQDNGSEELLIGLGLKNICVSGDTRFDRVSEILMRDNSLDFMDNFKGKDLCFVLGSTWPEDEALILPYLPEAPPNLKIVIAPHDIKEDHLKSLREMIPGKVIFYTETGQQDLSGFHVLILDTVGLLTRVYSYADLAYVGGGFATGLHNTLEPAVFGIPVITGPQYEGFREAEDLVKLGGITVADNKQAFMEVVRKLVADQKERNAQGEINSKYVKTKKGATQKVMDYIVKDLKI